MADYHDHFKKLQKRVRPQVRGKLTLLHGLLGAALLVTGYLFFNPAELDELESLIPGGVSLGVFGQAQAEGDGSKPGQEAQGTGPSAEKSAGTKTQDSVASTAPTKEWTEEEISLFRKLASRQSELDRRAEELQKLEEDLQKQRAEVDRRLSELSILREKIAQQLKDRVEQDQERVDKLVQVYSSMKPQSAAKVVETINEDLAVEVLSKMKQKSAAEILNLLPAEKSQRLSEKFAGYKRD